MGSPEGLLKRGSWSPPRLGLPSLGTHRKSNSPKLLAAPGPGKMEGGERKKEEKRFRLRDELSLWVSSIRGEPASTREDREGPRKPLAAAQVVKGGPFRLLLGSTQVGKARRGSGV